MAVINLFLNSEVTLYPAVTFSLIPKLLFIGAQHSILMLTDPVQSLCKRQLTGNLPLKTKNI